MVDGTPLEVHSVNTGVPHAVVFVDDVNALSTAEIRRLGACLRYHEPSRRRAPTPILPPSSPPAPL
ncbi:hypothetical protein [Verrucomicrobium spinosum]|uniref:hypothetical protein n=1 Tax=Verrucomicrobium spinosum TaxID=2736 RepID=UPI000A7964B8|nr:hypothetical protein [Verrucomicrobium spinosum]